MANRRLIQVLEILSSSESSDDEFENMQKLFYKKMKMKFRNYVRDVVPQYTDEQVRFTCI